MIFSFDLVVIGEKFIVNIDLVLLWDEVVVLDLVFCVEGWEMGWYYKVKMVDLWVGDD